MFVVNACRGSQPNIGVEPLNLDLQTDGVVKAHKKSNHRILINIYLHSQKSKRKDYIICYSTTSNNFSYRCTKRGSLYIHLMCKWLLCDCGLPFEQILKKINQDFQDQVLTYEDNNPMMQVADIRANTLLYEIFFKVRRRNQAK